MASARARSNKKIDHMTDLSFLRIHPWLDLRLSRAVQFSALTFYIHHNHPNNDLRAHVACAVSFMSSLFTIQLKIRSTRKFKTKISISEGKVHRPVRVRKRAFSSFEQPYSLLCLCSTHPGLRKSTLNE